MHKETVQYDGYTYVIEQTEAHSLRYTFEHAGDIYGIAMHVASPGDLPRNVELLKLHAEQTIDRVVGRPEKFDRQVLKEFGKTMGQLVTELEAKGRN